MRALGPVFHTKLILCSLVNCYNAGARRAAVLRSASHAMVSNAITTSPSPCGLNCSYTIEFAGPYLLCDEPQISNSSVGWNGDSFPIYIGLWVNPRSGIVKPYDYHYNLTYKREAEALSVANLNITILRPFAEILSGHVATQRTFFECRPGQATYNVNVTYINGVQNFDVNIESDRYAS